MGVGDEGDLRALGARLRALRRERGLTQWAMGERGVSYKYYQRLESGRVNATIRTLARVAQALGVSLTALFQHPGDHARRAAGGASAWRPGMLMTIRGHLEGQ